MRYPRTILSIFIFGGLCAKTPYHLNKNELEKALKSNPGKLLWHQWTPMVGLRTAPNQHREPRAQSHPSHAYYALHDLAPKQGAGVRVAFIDTGVAAFERLVDMPYHEDITLQPEVLLWKTNIIGHAHQPSVNLYKSYLAYIAGHGTHTMGIVAAQSSLFTGFAPKATSFMIKACHDNGTTTVQNLIQALRIAVAYKASIVNISLKINSYLDAELRNEIETLLSQIPYVVVPAGNDTENLLATLKGVTFSVGAYDYDMDAMKYSIPRFSAHTTHFKPLVLAPGVDIVSTGLAPGQREGVYVVADGTSAASACITGFLALLLGEVGIDYDKKKILGLIKKNCYALADTEEWRSASHWGSIDMRMALMAILSPQECKPSL